MNLILLERLHSKSSIIGSCWIYNGHTQQGYGRILVNKKKVFVHRVSLCIFFKLDYTDTSWKACHIDSLCKNKLCWNPLHLYIGNDFTNTQDAIKAGIHNGAKTHCPAGHKFTLESTYIYPDGRRTCKICMKENNRKWYRKPKSPTLDF